MGIIFAQNEFLVEFREFACLELSDVFGFSMTKFLSHKYEKVDMEMMGNILLTEKLTEIYFHVNSRKQKQILH